VRCAYCGSKDGPMQREHVFPRNLYPRSRGRSKVQRLTVSACGRCNNSWADDEAHFRNVLVLAGDPATPARTELWTDKVLPSFDKADGARRIADILDIMRPVMIPSGQRYKVYPADDDRVMRVIRKVIRGLSHYHGLETAVPDSRVWADVLRYQVPQELIASLEHHSRENDIAEYAFERTSSTDVSSAWIVTFFEKITFVGMVLPAPKGL